MSGTEERTLEQDQIQTDSPCRSTRTATLTMFNLEKKNRNYKSIQIQICGGPRFIDDLFFIQLNGTVRSLSPPLWFEAAVMRLLSVVLQHLTVAEKYIAAKYMFCICTNTHTPLYIYLCEDSLKDDA